MINRKILFQNTGSDLIKISNAEASWLKTGDNPLALQASMMKVSTLVITG